MILLFILLFIGTAQAEGWPDAPAVKCVLDARGQCITGAGFDVGCYQKMQEAMKWIDSITKSYNENKRRDPAFDFAKQYREYDKNQAKWDATMKECVDEEPKEQP